MLVGPGLLRPRAIGECEGASRYLVSSNSNDVSGSDMSMVGMGAGWPRLGAIVLAASVAMPGAASAQLFFDWGGSSEQKVNDSGRQLVRINIDAKPGEIIVSFSDRKLYLITAPGQALSYPVAIPREQDRWEGKTTVTQKRENPSWTPTPSMIKENPRLPRWVPGGHPMNPLGNRALYLGSSFYRIHGTDAPWTIGTAVSKGCIRMYNKDALDVYERTKVGAKVLVTWNQYKATPEAEQPQALSGQQTPQTAPQMTSRDESPSQATTSPPRQAASASRPGDRSSDRTAQASSSRATPDTRYNDVFGTSGPNDLPSAAPTEPQAAPAPTRQTRSRDAQQPPREPRRPREATTPPADRPEQQTSRASEPAVVAPAPASSQPAPRSAEPRQQRSAPVETGALPESRQRARSSETRASETRASDTGEAPRAASSRPAPSAPAQPDIATRALEAAERAAAAAERAAAAAERAERAATARAAAAVTGGSD